MKTLLCTLLFAAPLWAQKPTCTPDHIRIKECKEFTKTILVPAIYKDHTADPQDFPHRFVNDETQAVKYMEAYHPDKLAIKDLKCFFEQENEKCPRPEYKEPPGCESIFQSLHFFIGLIRGIKLNNWKPATKEKALSIIDQHVTHILEAPMNLLDALVAFQILQEAQAIGLLKDKFPPAHPYGVEGDKITQRLKGAWDKQKNSKDCKELRSIHDQEQAELQVLMKKWHQQKVK